MVDISFGPAYKQGRTWHRELQGKPEPVATQFHWVMRNCDGDEQDQRRNDLRQKLENIVLHYQNINAGCDRAARCRRGINYEPSCTVFVDPIAIIKSSERPPYIKCLGLSFSTRHST